MRVFQPVLLRNLRINRGFSLEMTARLVGLKSRRRVTRSAISHWERGQASPSVEHLLALGETFQVPVDYFFDPMPKYLFGNVSLPHTRRGKPPLPEMSMQLEPAMRLAAANTFDSRETFDPRDETVAPPVPAADPVAPSSGDDATAGIGG